MPKSKHDLIGKMFGKLRAVRMTDERKHGAVIWECICDCGNVHKTDTYSLTSGRVQSCGCYQKAQQKKAVTRHGHSGTRLEYIRNGIIKRCYNPKIKAYPLYGGRGITVCDEWRHSSEAFHKWAHEHGYADNLTLDRIDPNGNYEPSNCRWVTMKAQQNNRRNNRIIDCFGERHTAQEWSEITGICSRTIRYRLDNGWSAEATLTIPPNPGNPKYERN